MGTRLFQRLNAAFKGGVAEAAFNDGGSPIRRSSVQAVKGKIFLVIFAREAGEKMIFFRARSALKENYRRRRRRHGVAGAAQGAKGALRR